MSKAADFYATGKMPEAEKMILYNLEKFPGFLPGKDEAFMKLGEINYRKGDIQKAEQFFHQALNVNSKLALPLFRLGLIRDREGRPSDAIDYFEKALKTGADDIKMQLEIKENLAAALYRYGLQHEMYADWETAGKQYARILEIYPDFPEAVHAMGSILARQKKYNEALTFYKRAIEMNPELAVLYNDVSGLLMKLGKFKEAKAYQQKYDELMKEMVTSEEEEVLEGISK